MTLTSGASAARARQREPAARKVSGWPKRCKLAHAFLWEYSYKRLKLAQLLGQLGVFLTLTAFSTKPVQSICQGWLNYNAL